SSGTDSEENLTLRHNDSDFQPGAFTLSPCSSEHHQSAPQNFVQPHPSRCERAQESLKSLDIDRIVTFSDYRVSIGPRYSIMVLVSFLVFDVGLSLSAVSVRPSAPAGRQPVE